jgi:hypothetical protein
VYSPRKALGASASTMAVFPYWESDAQEAPLDDNSASPLARGGEAAGDDKLTGEMDGEGLENESRGTMRRMELPRIVVQP